MMNRYGQGQEDPRSIPLDARGLESVGNNLSQIVSGLNGLNVIVFAARLDALGQRIKMLATDLQRVESTKGEIKDLEFQKANLNTRIKALHEDIKDPAKGVIADLRVDSEGLRGRLSELWEASKDKDKQLAEMRTVLAVIEAERDDARNDLHRAERDIEHLNDRREKAGSHAEQVAKAVVEAMRNNDAGT